MHTWGSRCFSKKSTTISPDIESTRPDLADVERLRNDDVEAVGQREEEERRLHRDAGAEAPDRARAALAAHGGGGGDSI